MASRIIFALFAVILAASSVLAQPGAWGPPAWGGAAGWGAGAGGWGAGAGAWGPPAAPGLGARPGAAGVNTFLPPWLANAPWIPQWVPCATIGSTCVDCTTRAVCTKIGGIQKACTDPTLPYCNAGACSATPTAECAPASTTA